MMHDPPRPATILLPSWPIPARPSMPRLRARCLPRARRGQPGGIGWPGAAHAPSSDEPERAGLVALIGHDAPLADLNGELSERIVQRRHRSRCARLEAASLGNGDGQSSPSTSPAMRLPTRAQCAEKTRREHARGFQPAADLVAYLDELDRFIESGDQADPSSRTTTSASSITAANTRAPIGTTTACRATSGKSCWPKRAARRQGRSLRFAWPKEYGGKGGSNLWMAVIREHLAAKGLGPFNDLQTEHSIVGNNPFVADVRGVRARPKQYKRYSDDLLERHACAPASGSPSRTTAPTRRSWRRAPCRRTATASPAG